MGQIARMKAAERFRNEFEAEILKDCLFTPGQKVEFKGAVVGERNEDEGVVLWFKFLDKNGDVVEFIGERVYYQPDDDMDEDLVESVANQFNLAGGEARDRLKKAGLL